MVERLGWRGGLIALAGVIGACSHDWDPYDPRLGEDSTATAATTATSSGATTSSAGPSGSGAGGDSTSSTDVSSSASQGGGGAGSGGDGGAASTTGSGSTSESASSAGGGGSGPLVVSYPATVAACIDVQDPTPSTAECALEAAADAFTVDGDADPPRDVWHGFLRFDLDGTLAGRTVEGAQLRLVVADDPLSGSNQTGDVWESEPFDLASLSVSAPGAVGGAPLDQNQGSVTQGEVVLFDVSGLALSPGGSEYLTIVPVTGDGVDYLDEGSASPPTLIVTYR